MNKVRIGARKLCVQKFRSARRQSRLFIVLVFVFGVFASNLEVPPASALSGLTLEVDYTPDSAVVATSALRGTQIDLTASTPVAIAGTTQQEIVQQVDPELDLRSASDITAPTGWTIYYSTDGATYTSIAPTTLAAWEALRYVKANGPLVSEGADANGRQISSSTATGLQPDSGQFSTADDASGDGWDVIFDDMKRVYNIWHHLTATGIDCHLRTGARCDGSWPFLLRSSGAYTPSNSSTFEMAGSYNSSGWYDSVQKEIWIPTVYRRGVGGVDTATIGFACLSVSNISASNKWCGGSVTTGGFISPGSGADFTVSPGCGDTLYDCYQGIAQSGGRIFTWHVKTGDLACVDIRLNSGVGGPCASGGLIDFGASLPNATQGGFYYATLGSWDGRIYGSVNTSNTAGYSVCIEASTGAGCSGWTNPRSSVGGVARFTTLPGLASGDPMRAACAIGIGGGSATRVNCYNATGADISASLTSEFLVAYKTVGMGVYSNYNPAYGTRMYWGAGNANLGSGIHCWDFSLNSWCANWTAAGITDLNYQITLDPMKPTCLWSNADDSIIQTFNTITGTAGNCAVPAPTINFDGGMQLPRMACSSQNAIQSWKSFTLVTAVTYTSATFTAKDSTGAAIPSWTNIAVPANKIINLASLTVASTGQTPTFSVTMNGRTDEGDVSAKISAIGGSPELCLRPTIACPAPIVHPSQLTVNSVSVTATGSTTANSVVSQFDSVSRNVTIAQTPSSTCATSLSGNLSTGGGAAVAGVLVTLTDNTGTVFTYPADYPDSALRGQNVTATSDASGNYSFPLVAAGDYKLKFVDASGTVLVNQAIVTASGSGMTTDYTAATSLLSPAFTLVTGTPGVVNAKYNSSQNLTKLFFPSTVDVGQVSTLTFTISNTALAAKSGIGWVDSLPAGLVVDDNPNRRTTCAGGSSEILNPAAMTAMPGATSITVTGASINASVASCTYSVNVKATAAGDYRNGPSNVTTTDIDKNTDATVTALAPTAAGETLCDNNVFYLESGQLYRHPYNSLSRYAVGPTYTSGAVDAIGYNSEDGFLYGIARSTVTSNGVALTAGHLVRYSGSGILTDLGSMTGTGITDTVMATAVGGDFDNSGNLVVKATGSKSTLYSIDVATRVVTTITTSIAIQGDDLAYSGGAFYSSFGLYVYKTTISAGTSWTTKSTNMYPSNTSAHQTAYSDGSGRVVLVDGNRKAYELLDPSTATASADFNLIYTYANAPLDGAMCHAIPAPVANPDTSSGGKNAVQSKNLLENDVIATNATGATLVASSVKLCNPNSNPVEVSPNCTKGAGTSITVANVGTYSVDATGVVTFTPVNNYVGTPPALKYQVSDSAGNVGTSTYTPSVTNLLPSAINDTSSGAYDANQIISPLANDSAGTLSALDASSVKLCATTSTADASCNLSFLDVPNEGTYTVNANGTVTFDPYPTFKGTASPVKYVVQDGMSQVASATMTPTVTAPALPVANPESKSVLPGATATFTTTTGTSGLASAAAGLDPTLTCLIIPASSPATCDADGIVAIGGQGTYTLNNTTGVVTYVADAAATPGTKTAITYRVTDITGQTATSTLTPVIPPVPTATNDTSSGAYDVNQTISPLTNDSAGSGATLVASSIKLCATTSTANASCSLTFLDVPGQGTYTVNASGTVTFNPDPTFKGTASAVKYVVADSTTQLAGATITPTVAAPAVPTATAQTKSVIPGGTTAFTTLTGTSGLASSVAGFNTSVTCLITPASSPATCDADGVVTVTGVGTYTLDTATGVVTLVADPAATPGTKAALSYKVTDITGQTATSTLTPVVPPVPTATNNTSSGAYDTNQTISILTNDAAGAGATLVASSVKLCATTSTANASCSLTFLDVPGQGTYTVNASGTVTFNPDPTFKGTASAVKYVVADTTTQLAGATITPTVAAPAVPTATPQTKSVIPGGTTAFTTLTGTSGLASSVAGFNTSVTCLITPASSPATCDADGVVTVTGVGTYTLDTATGVVTLVADPAATPGTKAALSYKVTDITGQTATSTLTPTIPALPVAANDTSTGAYDTNQTISILTNDSATTPATLVASSVKLCATTATANASCNLDTLDVPNQGTYTVNANGTVTFNPLPTFSGTASPVKYVVADSNTQLDDATITPTVGLSAVPVATPNAKVVIPGGTVAFTTITGTSGLASAIAGLNPSATCLITPGSVPDTCDADGVVTVTGVGTYTLDTTTGVVTLVADSAATQGTKTALKYRVSDIFGQKATSTLTPTIPAPPVAANDTSSGAFDTNQTISILTNDSATTPATLVASSVKLCATTATANASCNLDTLDVPNQGTYTVNANGTVTFNPLPTFSGTASPVKYVVADSNTQLAGATMTPTVGLPAAPTATPNAQAVIPGGTVAFTTITGTSGLAASAVGFTNSATCLITPGSVPDTCDPDGVVTVTGVGTYTLDTATGVVTLVADSAATQGTKTALKYRVSDIFGQTATSTLTPTIPAQPVAVNDTSSGAYETNQIISVLTNDSASPPATLSASTVKLCATTATANASCNLDTLDVAGQGTYTVNANGTVTFVPLAGFTGVASPVKYVVADSTTQLAGATFTATVNPPGAPVVAPETKSVIPGGTVAFTNITGASGLASSGVGLNATLTCLIIPGSTPATCDADGVVTITGQGTYTLNTTTGVVTFAADPAATPGTKTAITYRATDVAGQTATSTLTPTIPAPPVAVNDTSSGAYDTNQTISILTNDSASLPATLTASSVKLCATTSTANASCDLTTLDVAGQGTYTVNANGTVTFNPLPTFSGTASPVKYVVADSTSQLDDATITPTVSLPAAPTATPNAQAIIPGGTVAFTTITGTSGLASSAAGLTSSATCLITPGSTPAACDTDGVVIVAGVGTYTLNTTTGVVTLVADPAATAGTKTALQYRVTDIFGQTATSTLTPTVPAAPTAGDDTSTGAYDVNQIISVLANDSASSPATLNASSVKLCATTSTANTSCDLTTLDIAGQGTYTVNANGTVTFNPLPTFTGTASPVKYVVADSTAQLDSATITPTVGLPAAPTATPNAQTVIPGGTVAFTAITGVSGLASSAASLNTSLTCLITPGSSPASCDADGVVTVAGVGTYTLNTTTGVVTLVADPAVTPGAKTAITYQVTDITGQTATSTLTVTIPAPPVAGDDTSSGAYDTNQIISILTNDSAATPATLVASSIKLCATTSTANASCNLTTLAIAGQGTYTVNANGTVTFNPLPTFTGTASPVKYVIADSTTQLDSATITPTVGLPSAPYATPQTKSVIPGGTVAFTTLTGVSGLASSAAGFNTAVTCLITPGSTPDTCDADGIVNIPGEGTYTLLNGVVSFTADANATSGTRTAITYQVSDIAGQTATATLTPTIPDAPSAANDNSSGAFDTNQTFSVVTNDSAATPATLDTSSVKLCATIFTANASCTLTELLVANEGTYRVNANGTVTFDPLPTFSGSASSVKYVVADSAGQLGAAFINVTVDLPTPPTATPNTLSVAPGGSASFRTLTGASGLASSIAGLNTAVTCLITPGSSPASCDSDGVVDIPGEGTFTLVNGVVTYTADANATTGTKTAITYQVTDIFGQTATSTLTPIIPAPPSATNDISSGAYDTNQTLTPVSNDQANSPATLVATSVKLCATTSTVNTSCNLTSLTVANQGTYTVNSNGTVTFNPLPTFAGQASPVKYVVADSTGQLANATMTPTVAAPPPPVATPDVKKVAPGTSVAFQPIFGAGALTSGSAELVRSSLCIVDPATNVCGTTPVVIEGEGVYTVDVDAGIITYKSIATAPVGERKAIAYKVTDVLGQTVTSTLTPIIPPAPTIVDDTSTGPWNTAQKLTPVANDTAGTGTTLVATSVKICAASSVGASAAVVCSGMTLTVAGEGTYTVNSDGTVSFVPLPTFFGKATTIKYSVSDAVGQVATANISVTVTPPPAPTAKSQTIRLKPGESMPFTSLTAKKGLGSSTIGWSSASTCLIVPKSDPATCDEDGIVKFGKEGTFKLNKKTGIVAFTAGENAQGRPKTRVVYQLSDAAGQKVQSTLTPIIPIQEKEMPATGALSTIPLFLLSFTLMSLGVVFIRSKQYLDQV